MSLFLPMEVASREIALKGAFHEMHLEHEYAARLESLQRDTSFTEYQFMELICEAKEETAEELFLLKANQRYTRHKGLQLIVRLVGNRCTTVMKSTFSA